MSPILSEGRVPIRWAVIGSVAVLALAVLALSGLVAGRLAVSLQAATEKEIDRAAREILFTVDREISSIINVLVLMKQSKSLQDGNIDAFYDSAVAAAKAVGFDIVLFDVSRDEQLVNTAFPRGTKLPHGIPFPVGDTERASLRSGRPILSDVFLDPLLQRSLVAVGVPILGVDIIDQVVVALVPLDRFFGILQQLRLEDDWIATILDRDGNIIARSKDQDSRAGKPATSFALIEPGVSSGMVMGPRFDGLPSAWIYRRSNVTNWIICVGLPQSVLREPWFFTLGGLLIVGIIVVFASVTTALRVSHRFVQSVSQLRDAVFALQRGGQPAAGAGSQSLDGISSILTAASAELMAAGDSRQFLASAADIGVWQWNLSDGTQLWSERCRELFGFGPQVALRREHFLERLHPTDRDVVENTLERCMAEGEQCECEYRIIRANDGQRRWFRAKARISRNERGQAVGVLGIMMDITAHKEAEHEIQDSAARLKALVETVSDGVILIDGNGRILLFNPACERLFGYRATEAVGDNVKMLMALPERDEHDRYIADFRRTGIRKIIGSSREVRGRHKDGTVFPLHLSVGEVRRDGEPLAVGILHDLTARKETEREHENLRRRLMRAQETERLHLAHELHDEAGQGLAAAMLDLKRLEPLVEGSGVQLLRHLMTQFDRMGKNLHRIARELRPMAIDDLGLGRALADYIAEWSERFGINVDYQCANVDLDALPSEVSTVLYRICQEALTNVAKHAVGTTVVSIVVDCSHELLQLTIEDNGCGFDPGSVAADLATRGVGGLGLAGMRERLALIGGELQIESSAGFGTTIFVRIALASMEMTA